MANQVAQDEESLKKDETFSLIAASKVQGTDVYSTGGEHVGDVDEFTVFGLRQLSVENAYSVSVPMPCLGAASTMRRMVSTPASGPRTRDRPRRVAHRPLPSMMMPT